MLRKNQMEPSVALEGSLVRSGTRSPQKVLILGKCHVRSIAACWTALRPKDTVEAVTWTRLRKGLSKGYSVEWLCRHLEHSDIVVSQAGPSGNLPGSDTTPFAPSTGSKPTHNMGIASSAEEINRLTALLDRAILFPRWSFSGFHPDMRRAYESAYSELAFAAFSMGLPKERAASLYNAFIYTLLGYFDEYAKAERHGIAQGQACGLNLAAIVAPNQGKAFMYSPSHPTIDFWWRVTLLLCERAGLDIDDRAQPPADPAEGEICWPVYPEIAKRVGVEGSLSFRLSKFASFVDLDQMIDQSWRMFETLDFTSARATPRVEAVISALRGAGV